jgi:hypothetical protein
MIIGDPAWEHLPRGLMSLLDMINFVLLDFSVAYRALDQEIAFAAANAQSLRPLTDDDLNRITGNLQWISDVSHRLALSHSNARLSRTLGAIRKFKIFPITYKEINDQLIILKEAIDDDIRIVHFFHHPPEKAELLLRFEIEWRPTISAFRSTRDEIIDAIDCYAMGHGTASVFHMMRVAELGLRALARERGVTFSKKPLEWANWQEILEQTEAKTRAATKGMAPGPAKDAAAAFYSGAIGQMHAFKDTYRNVTMHVRKRYDELDALRAINQVRDFMNGLSSKIDEKTSRPIKRWP